jgi:hypothetical protein
MKRHAFIIVTPNCEGQKQLPGADHDADLWESFLRLPEGGAWHPDEISILKDPEQARLVLELTFARASGPDFALLAFSGHGECVETTRGRESRMYLSTARYLTEKTFTLDCRRELLIIDACREYRLESSIESFLAKVALANDRLLENRRLDRHTRARKLFDDAIAQNPEGRSFVYSCDVNQTASDRPSFTQVLIERATDLVTNDPLERIATIQDVFPAAAELVSTFNQPQKAVYEAGRRITHLPFAVSV